MMKFITTSKTAKPLRIIPVAKSGFHALLKRYPETLAKWVEASGFRVKTSEFLLVPDGKGCVQEVIFITEDKPGVWSYAGLPSKLPQGVYEIDAKFTSKQATDIVVGWMLGTYYFDRYKKNPWKFATLKAPANSDMEEAEITVDAMFLARDLINTPPCDMGPEEMAIHASELARRHKAKCRILKDGELLKEGYSMLYAVGKGAEENRPMLADISWGDPKDQKVTLVGKGVCFDTGGLNLKGDKDMLLMKKDMGGAAVALALAGMIMASSLPVRLRLLLPLVENSISGKSYRPSDIIRTRNGITVEVGNTDAEGRLILCEPLAEADSEKPDLLIDFATLTGAARVALGTEVPAFFTNSDALAADIERVSRDEQDPMWRMPLWADYRRMLDSKVADINNVPDSGHGGAITAALFLKEFVEKTKSWAHIDMMAWNVRTRPGRPVGGEAMCLRAIYGLVKQRCLE